MYQNLLPRLWEKSAWGKRFDLDLPFMMFPGTFGIFQKYYFKEKWLQRKLKKKKCFVQKLDDVPNFHNLSNLIEKECLIIIWNDFQQNDLNNSINTKLCIKSKVSLLLPNPNNSKKKKKQIFLHGDELIIKFIVFILFLLSTQGGKVHHCAFMFRCHKTECWKINLFVHFNHIPIPCFLFFALILFF